MVESIKETDRYTNDERLQLTVGGAAVTVMTAGLNYALYTTGYYSLYLICLLLAGPSIMIMSCVSEFKGNIKMQHCPRQSQSVCPSCQEQGTMEWYNEKVGQNTERQYRVVYTIRKTTTHWRRMVHCLGCGLKAVRGEDGNIDMQQAASDDPVAKARAHLETYNARRGRKTYEKVNSKDDLLVATANDMELTEKQLSSTATPIEIV